MPSTTQMDDGGKAAPGGAPYRRVSADSFKSLMERLKQPASAPVAVSIAKPADLLPIPPAVALAPPPEQVPSLLPVPRVEEAPVAAQPGPEPQHVEQGASEPAIEQEVEAFAPERAAETVLGGEESNVASVAELPSRVETVAAPAPVSAPVLANAPPILPPPAPPPRPVEVTAPVAAPLPVHHRRPLVDPELEFVMRLVVAVPTTEERIRFLNDAAEIAAHDRLNAAPPGELAQIEEEFLRTRQAQLAQSGATAAVTQSEAPIPPPEADLQPAPIEESRIEPREVQSQPEHHAVEQAAPFAHEEASAPSSKMARAPSESFSAPPSPLAAMDGAEASELARSLLDMMASGVNTGLPHERALAADTLLRIVPRLPVSSLIMLADRLSIMDNPPYLLISKLIRDPRIEVSGPLLENSMHITDRDLLEAIDEPVNAKRRLIARRRRLSREISDRLIATDDASVQLTLVRNANAEISHAGFLRLSSAASRESELLAPLCTRADLPAPFAFELFWVAPVQLRRYLLSRFLTDSETLTKILKITLATQGGEEMAETTFPSAAELAGVIHLLVTGKLEEAAAQLAAMLNLSQATIARVLSDTQGEALTVMLKALGCARNDFPIHMRSLATCVDPFLPGPDRVDELQALFDQMSFNKARILLTYWDWAVRQSGPYAPLH